MYFMKKDPCVYGDFSKITLLPIDISPYISWKNDPSCYIGISTGSHCFLWSSVYKSHKNNNPSLYRNFSM